MMYISNCTFYFFPRFMDRFSQCCIYKVSGFSLYKKQYSENLNTYLAKTEVAFLQQIKSRHRHPAHDGECDQRCAGAV